MTCDDTQRAEYTLRHVAGKGTMVYKELMLFHYRMTCYYRILG